MSSEPQEGDKPTDIVVEQKVGSVAQGGQVVGAQIEGATGTVNVYYEGRADLQPVDTGTLRGYLEQASQTPPAAKGLEALWAVGFRAGTEGSDTPQELYQAVKAALAESKLHGGFQRLVLLAQAGSGGTASLKNWLQSKRAAESLPLLPDADPGDSRWQAPPDCIIPLYISLADLWTHQPLPSLARDAFNALIEPGGSAGRISADQASWLLGSYTCLFLLDHLDELLSAQNKGGLQTLSQFMEANPNHQYVIACHTSSYGRQLGALNRLYLDDLSPDEVRSILGAQLYDALDAASRELLRVRRSLEQFLNLNKPDRPLDLQTKGRFLHDVIEREIEENDLYDDRGIDREVASGLLQRLAISMRREHTHTYNERHLKDLVTAYLQEWQESAPWRKTVETLCDAAMLTCDREQGSWGFHDRSFEAYFAAAALVQDEEGLREVLDAASDFWWRDVFEILVGLTPSPETLLLELIDRDVFVAASCLPFAGTGVGQQVEDALVDALIERMESESPSRRKYIVERIAAGDHPRAAEALLLALYRDWSSVVVEAAAIGLRLQLKKHPELVREAERRGRYSQLGDIGPVSHFLRLFEPSADNAKQLIGHMQDRSQVPRVRGLAAIGLGLMAEAAVEEGVLDQARGALLGLIEDEKMDDYIAWCGVEALTHYNQPQVRERVHELFRGEKYCRVEWSRHRARAAYLLGWVSPQQDGAGFLLKEALSDPVPFVRGYAVDAMARLDLAGAREEIERLLADPREGDPFVLRKAAKALGQIGTLDSIPVLERYLRQDRPLARLAVRQAISEIRERQYL